MLPSEAAKGVRVRATGNTYGISGLIPNTVVGRTGTIKSLDAADALVDFDEPFATQAHAEPVLMDLYVPLRHLVAIGADIPDDNVAV